ncbi:MAG: ribonuclease H-like domain-containing protein [Chthonomonadales bacterium]|nr:ribonuclease H-like domain-containing protein [Chthonomonadales bacterium]
MTTLERTFCHCSGIGPTTEVRLWQSSVQTWGDVLAGRAADVLSSGLAARLEMTIAESQIRMSREDARWFASVVPRSEHWRAADAFGQRVAFLDIETTGSFGEDLTTVVGIHDGERLHQFVRHENLRDWLDLITDRTLLVTFSGSSFDLPFLRREFGVPLDVLHIDLCPLLRRLGYKGGLKAVEQQLGVVRPDETAGLSGFDAVRLWFDWERNDNEQSLRTLLAYNAEDVLNMRHLLAFALERMRERLWGV